MTSEQQVGKALSWLGMFVFFTSTTLGFINNNRLNPYLETLFDVIKGAGLVIAIQGSTLEKREAFRRRLSSEFMKSMDFAAFYCCVLSAVAVLSWVIMQWEHSGILAMVAGLGICGLTVYSNYRATGSFIPIRAVEEERERWL